MKKFIIALLLSLSMSPAFAADGDIAKEVPFVACTVATVVNPLVGAGCFVVGWLSLASYEAGKQSR